MNINDQVFIVNRANFHGNSIANSIAIIPAKIVSMGESIVCELGVVASTKVIIAVVDEISIYPTIAKALEEVQKELTAKPQDSTTNTVSNES